MMPVLCLQKLPYRRLLETFKEQFVFGDEGWR